MLRNVVSSLANIALSTSPPQLKTSDRRTGNTNPKKVNYILYLDADVEVSKGLRGGTLFGISSRSRPGAEAKCFVTLPLQLLSVSLCSLNAL